MQRNHGASHGVMIARLAEGIAIRGKGLAVIPLLRTIAALKRQIISMAHCKLNHHSGVWAKCLEEEEACPRAPMAVPPPRRPFSPISTSDTVTQIAPNFQQSEEIMVS